MTTATPDLETRAWDAAFEVREQDTAFRLVGHAAVFNVLSGDLHGFREKIAPGAFADAVKVDDVRFLLNHAGLPLARTVSNTLRLSEDQRGLAFEADLDPGDPDVGRILPKIRRGDLNQMSFAFRTIDQSWAADAAGAVVRTLSKVRLFDISLVTYPAYPQTDVAVRSLDAWTATQGRRREGLARALAQQGRMVG